jgi:DNA-binding MarR family transcriptional regulator/DNA-binding CsgD family transcriptional regulator
MTQLRQEEMMWETVGIPENEARVYEALIPQAHATADALAGRVNFTTAKTARALASLIERGLVSRMPGRPARYTAVEPSLAGSVLIAKREHELRQLQQHLDRLDDMFRTEASAGGPGGPVEVIEGAPKIWRTFVRVQRAARREVRGFDKPPYFVPAGEHGDEGPNLEERRLLAASAVTYRVVYDQEAVAIPGRLENIRDGIRSGEMARVAKSLPVKLVMCDDTMAILCSSADYSEAVAYLIRPSSLLEMASGLFEAVWDRAVPLNRSGAKDGAPAIDGRDRQLLSLLASGATDATIARTFEWSMRTVQRHIHELMQSVGARTRFQLGMEAADRGWL